jgi:phosphoserine aminotransferase
MSDKPTTKPNCPNFSSGPCAKRPGYTVSEALKDCPLGRSHRSNIGKQKIAQAITDTKRILHIPDNYRVGIVAGSDTGAFEMAMWTMLGSLPVDVCFWESFGEGWMIDAVKQLPLTTEKGGKGVNQFSAAYGELPPLEKTNPDHDIIFTLNGTTSGVCVPNMDWIKSDRKGLTLCDATSGIFAMDIDWSKVDVVTYSWQKVLGGEGGHGMLIMSPRAVERVCTYTPPWPLPKLFRMAKGGKLDEALFQDSPINTPSMMCIEDYLDALKWADSIGGTAEINKRTRANFDAVAEVVDKTEWLEFLAKDPKSRSITSVCLVVKDCNENEIKQICSLLSKNEVAHDVASYRDAPAGLRFWCGATVLLDDVRIAMQWLVWAHDQVKSGTKA